MDGLVRLADFGFLQADDFRQLTSGYMFLRTIEHVLQLAPTGRSISCRPKHAS